jgi:hypothetical protein
MSLTQRIGCDAEGLYCIPGKRRPKRLPAAQGFSSTHRQCASPGDLALFRELMANGQGYVVLVGLNKAIVRDRNDTLR